MVTPKGRMNPQPSGMTVPDESFRVDPSHFPRPQKPVNPLSGYGRNPFGTALWNTAVGAGGAVGDIGRRFFVPGQWQWGKDAAGDPVEYNPAFQPGPADPMAQRAGYGLIDAMTMGLPTGPPNFETMTGPDIAMQFADLVDPTGLGGDVAKLSAKVIDFDTVAGAFGVLTAKGKDLLKNTKAVDTNGDPLVLYHGSRTGWTGDFDPAKEVENTLFGPGVYFTEDPLIAGGSFQNPGRTPGYSFLNLWSGKEGRDAFDYPGIQPTVRRNYIDVRNPIDMDSYTPEVTNLLYDELLNTTSRVAANNPVNVQKRIYLDLLDELINKTYVDPTEVDSIVKIINSGKFKDAHEPLKGIMNRTFADNQQAYMFAVGKLTRHYKDAGIGSGRGPYGSKGYAQEEIQEIFKNAGYDSITHLGGSRTGQEELHRVYIVFSDFYERHGKPRAPFSQKELDSMAGIGDDLYASYFDRIVNWPDVETSPLDPIPAGGAPSEGWKLPTMNPYSEETNVENLIKAIEDASQRRNR